MPHRTVCFGLERMRGRDVSGRSIMSELKMSVLGARRESDPCVDGLRRRRGVESVVGCICYHGGCGTGGTACWEVCRGNLVDFFVDCIIDFMRVW